MPCEICCSLVLKSVYCFPSASPPDFTGNVLRALLKAKAGSTVTLECKPQAYPIASILWKKGNLPIHTNDRYSTETTSSPVESVASEKKLMAVPNIYINVHT